MSSTPDDDPSHVPQFPPPGRRQEDGPYRVPAATAAPPEPAPIKTRVTRPDPPPPALASSASPRTDAETRREVALADFERPGARPTGGGGLFGSLGRPSPFVILRVVALVAIAARVLVRVFAHAH